MSVSSAATRPQRLILHWFRHGDLRVHDNPALVHSCKQADHIIPVFCFDSNIFGDSVKTPSGSLKCGPRRAKFVLESVTDLRKQLKGSLVVAHGRPDLVFGSILTELKDSKMEISIVCQEEVLKEERDAVQAVQSVLKLHRPRAKLQQIWGSTMYELTDLPFDENLSNMPDTFTPFRNKVEKACKIPKPLPTPKVHFPLTDSVEYKAVFEKLSYLPTLTDLGYTAEQVEEANHDDPRAVMAFCGGESAALARLKEYVWDKDLLKDYFDTRNGMLGADYSSKFSPWLAHGCLSARRIAMECHDYEQQRVANKSTYWMIFELLWRDFCKFFARKYGDVVFYPGGTAGKTDYKWSTYENNFDAWKDGKTGYPLVDANMRELRATGFMSNRGRQNVASYLSIDLNYDWRRGGDFFETYLLDYDVYSNWVNWCGAAGMMGGRLNRFNIVKQSKDYDVNGDYVRHWLPELKDVPKQFVHEPWKMTQFQQMESNCLLGVAYPNPITKPSLPPDSYQSQGKSKGGDRKQTRSTKPNTGRNPHQRYEMKSVRQGRFDMK
ncbi:hypothetical protein MPSEU_000094300 [Mayamaea pseudoterrestris]|nr:hypothetical protein MPSEU_000094300 [Mayamaea pseudoterrestris]